MSAVAGAGGGPGAGAASGADGAARPERMVTVWCPDWPVTAAGCAPDVPAAVLRAHRVVARTAAAGEQGVVIGQRRRQAQQRCPRLELLDDDPARDARAFESAVRAVADAAPRVDLIEPGWLSVAARGPSRAFGGDAALAEHLLDLVAATIEPLAPRAPRPDAAGTDAAGPATTPRDVPADAGPSGAGPSRAGDGAPGSDPSGAGRAVAGRAGDGPSRPTVGVGVADGRFAAGVAARLSVRRGHPVVVEPGGSPAFCAPLPIGWLQTLGEADAELVDLLVRLGVRRLGELAALDPADVLGRFGPAGLHAHRLAAGVDPRPASTADPAPERRLDRALDDPAARADAVVFVAKQLADELAGALAADGRVCTRLVVLLETEHGERCERSWYRSSGMSAAAMLERIRWQLDGWMALPRGSVQRITGGISLVRLTPEEVRADDGEQLGLWGGRSEADRRAARAIARLTTLTSEHAVTVPVWQGGRPPVDRYRWTPATTVDLDRRGRAASRDGTGAGLDGSTGPWPGSLPAPSPATVLASPRPIDVLDADGEVVRVGGRGDVSAPPAAVRLVRGSEAAGWRRGPLRAVRAWAGPWPVDQRWWEPERHRRLARLQVVVDAADDGDGGAGEEALLVVIEHQRWHLAAVYS